MLSSLKISNYILIDSLQIEFDEQMNVITGETGAGKSIIMGALALILGNRADTSVLLDKSKKCIVEAAFDVSNLNLKDFFEENDLDAQPLSIIRREINENGKSRAFINDTPVTLVQLKDLASQLIDIHSQHSNLLFTNADFRVNVIDEFAQTKPLLNEYQIARAEYEQKKSLLSQLAEKRQENLERKDYYEFVLNELQSASLQENEQEELENEIDFLSHTESIKSNLNQILQILSGSDDSLLDALRQLNNLSASVSSYRDDLKDISNRFDSSYIELKDLESEVASINDKVDYSPQLLEEKKERLDLLYTLQQKYHAHSVEELMAKRDELAHWVSDFSSDDEKIANCQKECDFLYKKAWEKAEKLSKSRSKSLRDFESFVIEKIQSLGINDGRFVVQITPFKELHKNGIDDIVFLFSANKGIELAELGKVASGGEISRLMLAVKATISDKTILPTIVFDEIDVGISGEVAAKVGRAMRTMADKRQLLVITHLPHIAAKATRHFQVYKKLENDMPHTLVKVLNNEDRVSEIAEMMSGEQCGEASLLAAKELINK